MRFIDGLREIAFCPSLITCTCPGGTMIHPTCKLGTARLHADREWLFDLKTPGALQDWVWRRLLEYYWYHIWPSPSAVFPSPSTASGEVTPSNVLGPLHHPSRTAVHQGLVLTLLGHAPPKRNPRLHLRTKWLEYLYLGETPQLDDDRFPPLNGAVGTMVLSHAFDEEAALALWGIFERCNVRLSTCAGWAASGFTPPRAVDDEITLRSVNGVTVVFLSLVAWEHRKVFCSNWTLQGIILDDLLRHGLGWLMFQHRDPFSLSVSTRLFFQPLHLGDINEGAIMWSSIFAWLPADPHSSFPASQRQVRLRAILLFRTWATRYNDSLPYLNVLRLISPAWYEKFDWRDLEGQRERFAVSCGWALGTGVALVVEQFERLSSVSGLKAQVAPFFREYFSVAIKTGGRRTPLDGLVSRGHWSRIPELSPLCAALDEEWRDLMLRMDTRNEVKWEHRAPLIVLLKDAFHDALLHEDDPDARWKETAVAVRSTRNSPVSLQLVPDADKNQLLEYDGTENVGADFAEMFMMAFDERWGDAWEDGLEEQTEATWDVASALVLAGPQKKVTFSQQQPPSSASPTKPLITFPMGQLLLGVGAALLAVLLASISQGWLGRGFILGQNQTLSIPESSSTGRITERYEAGSSLILGIGDQVEILGKPIPGWVQVRTAGGVAVSHPVGGADGRSCRRGA